MKKVTIRLLFPTALRSGPARVQPAGAVVSVDSSEAQSLIRRQRAELVAEPVDRQLEFAIEPTIEKGKVKWH